MPRISTLELTLATQLEQAGIPFEQQYKFVPGRRFAADFKVGDNLLVECDGGVFSRSASHSSIKGIVRDMEKLNLATLGGYRVLRFHVNDINDGTALAVIQQAIGGGA